MRKFRKMYLHIQSDLLKNLNPDKFHSIGNFWFFYFLTITQKIVKIALNNEQLFDTLRDKSWVYQILWKDHMKDPVVITEPWHINCSCKFRKTWVWTFSEVIDKISKICLSWKSAS